jgi:hypothetical protein
MKIKYYEHKQNAKRRNIPFLLTYNEWISIWKQSGHWEERGLGKGKYVMCRYNDIGPYSINNVYIDLMEVNAGQARLGDRSTKEHSQKISQALKGKSKSASAVRNNAIAQLSRPKYNCPHCNKLISGQGNVKQHIASKHGIAA